MVYWQVKGLYYRNRFPYHIKLTNNVAGGAFNWLRQQDLDSPIHYDYSTEFEVDTMFYHFFFADQQVALQFTLANWEDNV